MPPQLIGSGVAEVCSSCSPGESHRPDGREKENRCESSRAWSRSWGEQVGEQQSLEQEQGGQPDHSTLPTASSALTLQTDAAAAETGASPLQESLQLNYNRDLMEEKIYEILKVSSGLDQFVLLKSKRLIVRLEVSFTVRGQTHQTGLDGFELSPSAEITRHVSRSSVTAEQRVEMKM
ncbi:hypothetical protein JZ751_016255 [Albula glossodonta]|uniref:Uncharacterized protein n=1 Tax=Albula glossodonta TaxID=121402 RepID=A0A8T2MUF1_9TELE|nr:hypothetical protein JZ751_016255 [Albula glossodonta]